MVRRLIVRENGACLTRCLRAIPVWYTCAEIETNTDRSIRAAWLGACHRAKMNRSGPDCVVVWTHLRRGLSLLKASRTIVC
jgi:hypothetical protein